MTAQATAEKTDRQKWMGLLAKSSAEDVERLWSAYGQTPAHQVLRAPEIGSVMVRGRSGAVGAAFNLGEMTVTRCSIRLASGEDGHAYVQGRQKAKATQAALVDALMQTEAAPQVRAAILAPLEQQMKARKASRSAKAAATKVDFFTMARGED